MKSRKHSWTGTSLRRFLSVILALVLLLSTGLSSIAAAMEVEVPDEEVENIKTVDDLVKYIENHK